MTSVDIRNHTHGYVDDNDDTWWDGTVNERTGRGRSAAVPVHTIGGYIRVSPELTREIEQARQAEGERHIGPIHGPPVPRHLALTRRLGGHPTGPYRRHHETD